ncbi:hypothetical protein [Streptomyces zhihengii]|uniref:hypothetical protein n=1 Tax=Streptomyces zhihengii TaxID=1818004 RepID=UPI0033ADFC24
MSWLTTHLPILLPSLAFFSTFTGVVLPAVWSTQPARRQAAAAVLTQLVGVVRRGPAPTEPNAPVAPACQAEPAPPPHHTTPR